jgi:hypothetical protein
MSTRLAHRPASAGAGLIAELDLRFRMPSLGRLFEGDAGHPGLRQEALTQRADGRA